MKIKSLFAPVQNMTVAEANVFIKEHQEGSYTLLDVRQEGEYAKARIPGALPAERPGLSSLADQVVVPQGCDEPLLRSKACLHGSCP